MLATEKGKRVNHWLGLYRRDENTFAEIRDMLEEESGRPASPTTVVIYLLQMYRDRQERKKIAAAKDRARDNKVI